MRTIYKYPVAVYGNAVYNLPEGFAVRHVGFDPQGIPCVWIEVNTERPATTVEFVIVGTGREIGERAVYAGTFTNEPFVWHVHYQVLP